MARVLEKLTARGVATVMAPGRHSDGGGLFLVVDRGGAKRWVFLFRWKETGRPGAGRIREMGLGSFNAVSLAKARVKAAAARARLADRTDPILARKREYATPKFSEVAADFIEARSREYRSDKSIQRLRRALEVNAADLSLIPVDKITTDDVVRLLKDRWADRPESARKLRGYIEAVLDAARARGLRTGDNPARWRGHLDHLLARPQRLSRGHHAAMPYKDLPAFMRRLDSDHTMTSLMLQFLILTASRSGEALGAVWPEINLIEAVWTVPAERMKSGRLHRVPLSQPALEILRKAAEHPLTAVNSNTTSGFVFPGAKKGRPMSAATVAGAVRACGVEVATVHGFRSTFRDWAGEETEFPREIAEAALAHTVGDRVELAYRRGDALRRRRELMVAWAHNCCSTVTGSNQGELSHAS